MKRNSDSVSQIFFLIKLNLYICYLFVFSKLQNKTIISSILNNKNKALKKINRFCSSCSIIFLLYNYNNTKQKYLLETLEINYTIAK